MTKETKLKLLKYRLTVLEGRGNKNIKAPGVMKKVQRQIRNLEK